MHRVPTDPRVDWIKRVESQGFLFHSAEGRPYWDESAYYLFEAAEIDEIEGAKARLDAMCLEAVGRIIEGGRLGELGIPDRYHPFVARSWERDEHTVYGRFDLSYDGVHPPKLLEYNADTPTALLEAAVVQWFWSRDLLSSVDPGGRDQFDQFDSIHERLIEAWARVGRELGTRVTFAALAGSVEDVMTVSYLRDIANQAGLKTAPIAVKEIGWHGGRRVFTDLRERPIELMFKLYPWEWMLAESFGPNLGWAPTRWLEPPWKMALSSKAILPILYEFFPESPYLLKAGFEPFGASYASKPVHSREGANVTLVADGRVLAETDGDYRDGARIYQQYEPLPEFGGRYPVVGSWMVNGHPCGIGIREDDGPITRNSSRFVPHFFRKSTKATPPTMGQPMISDLAGGRRSPQDDPLWDRWIDR